MCNTFKIYSYNECIFVEFDVNFFVWLDSKLYKEWNLGVLESFHRYNHTVSKEIALSKFQSCTVGKIQSHPKAIDSKNNHKLCWVYLFQWMNNFVEVNWWYHCMARGLIPNPPLFLARFISSSEIRCSIR